MVMFEDITTENLNYWEFVCKIIESKKLAATRTITQTQNLWQRIKRLKINTHEHSALCVRCSFLCVRAQLMFAGKLVSPRPFPSHILRNTRADTNGTSSVCERIRTPVSSLSLSLEWSSWVYRVSLAMRFVWSYIVGGVRGRLVRMVRA